MLKSEVIVGLLKRENNLDKAILSLNGYSFLFLDIAKINIDLSSFEKLIPFDIDEGTFAKRNSKLETLNIGVDIFSHDISMDLFIGGSLKTLLPDLKFGGYENLFTVLILILNPDSEIFPILFYFGPSGIVIGGSNDKFILSSLMRKIPNEIIIVSPFSLKKENILKMISILKRILRRVPLSDYQGTYQQDYGNLIIGLENKIPYLKVQKNKNSQLFKNKIISSIALNKYGEYIVSGTWDGELKVWDINSNTLLNSKKAHDRLISKLIIDNNNKLYSCSWDGCLKIWDLPSLKILKTIKCERGAIHSVFLKDGQLILSLFDDSITEWKCWLEYWEIRSNKLIEVIECGNYIPLEMTFNREHLIGSYNFNKVGIFNLPEKKLIKVLRCSSEIVESAILTPDKQFIISGSDTYRFIWDFNNYKLIQILNGGANNIIITHDMKYLIRSNFNEIYIEEFNTHNTLSSCEDDSLIRNMISAQNEKYIYHDAGKRIKMREIKSLKIVNRYQ